MTATLHTTGRARLHMPRPVIDAHPCRTVLPVADAVGVTAELPPADDFPPGSPPVVAVWSEGFDAELDAAGIDDFLVRLDAFRDGLKTLRLLLGPGPRHPRP